MATSSEPAPVTPVTPVALTVAALPPISMTNSPKQLLATVAYSNGSSGDASNIVSWSASGAGTVTTSGLFFCTGLGTASVSANTIGLTATTQTSCLDAPMPTQKGVFIEHASDFAGPFPSWLNVKTAYGAKGDGASDDTAALQAALTEAVRAHRVLWLPHGTYNISSALSISNCYGVSIIGEDPRTTVIRWMGTLGGTMLDSDGCKAIQISRISFDGNNTAGKAERIWWSWSSGSNYPTFDLLTDQTIENVEVGIELGFAGETTVERVHFDNDSSAGISTENWNAHNLNVSDSLFTGCGIGITNTLPPTGEGTFNVTNSGFSGSKVADMKIENTGQFSVRHNLSVGSKAFFISGDIGAPALLTFQGNTIVSPSIIPIQIGTPSPLTLIDNTFLGMSSKMPIVSGTGWKPSDIFSLGNRAASAVPFSGDIGKINSIDDLFSFPVLEPMPSVPADTYVPPLSDAKAFDVPPGADSSVIQALVDAASQLPGGGVVHFPSGQFDIDSSIIIPKGGPVQMIGDGPFWTTLRGTATLSGAVLKVESLQARISQLFITQETGGGSPTAEGIKIDVPDTPSSEVIIDEVKGYMDRGLFVDGVDQALIEGYSWQLGSADDLAPASQFIGGPTLGAGAYAFGRVNMFQAGTDAFAIDSNARFLEEDFFHDGGENSPAIEMTGGAGSVTVSGSVFNNRADSSTTVAVDNFKGNISLESISSSLPLELGQHSEDTSLMLAASEVQFARSPVNSEGKVDTLGELLNANTTGNRPTPVDDSGNVSANWIEQMLGPLRTQAPRPRWSLSDGDARIRVERVMLGSLNVGIHIMPDQQPINDGSQGMYILRDRNGVALDSGSEGDCVSEAGGSDLNTAWTIQAAPDGGIFIQSPAGLISAPIATSGTGPILAALHMGAYQEWVVLPVGDGYFQLANRATDQAIVSNGSGGCLGLAPPNGDADEEWEITAANEGSSSI